METPGTGPVRTRYTPAAARTPGGGYNEDINHFRETNILPPEPPCDEDNGELTLCELNCQLLTLSHENSANADKFAEAEGLVYPVVVAPEPGGPWKRTRHRVQDIMKRPDGAMDKAVNGEVQAQEGNSGVSNLVKVFWKLHNTLLYGDSLFPSTVSKQQGGARMRVKGMAWHPYRQYLALAIADNTVHIYDLGSRSFGNVYLEHEYMENITALEWRPNAGNTLAVGCSNGISLWMFVKLGENGRSGTRGDPQSFSGEQTAWMTHLSTPGHSPVTQIAWHPNGHLLASASSNDNAIIIWDTAVAVGTPLRRFGGGNIGMVKWSPSGEYLFAAHTTSMFRIWETKTWTCEKWTNLAGPVQTATWSPDGRHLIFACKGAASFHTLKFNYSAPRIGATSTVVLMTAPFDVTYESNRSQRVCGAIRQVAWDPTGTRVAVTFEGNPTMYDDEDSYDYLPDGAELVALYSVKSEPVPLFSPMGFIRGPPRSGYVQSISFRPHFPRGALLCVGYSEGRFAFFPLYFKPNATPWDSGTNLLPK